jgi:hypothetical protein
MTMKRPLTPRFLPFTATLTALFCSVPPPPEHPVKTIIDYTVLWTDSSVSAFKQCSRPSPVFHKLFTPTHVQIDTMFFDLRKNRKSIEANLPLPIEQYQYQAIGFNDSLIYLNCFASSRYHGIPDWRATPVVECKGGGMYWGIVYDINRRTFGRLSINRGN